MNNIRKNYFVKFHIGTFTVMLWKFHRYLSFHVDFKSYLGTTTQLTNFERTRATKPIMSYRESHETYRLRPNPRVNE